MTQNVFNEMQRGGACRKNAVGKVEREQHPEVSERAAGGTRS